MKYANTSDPLALTEEATQPPTDQRWRAVAVSSSQSGMEIKRSDDAERASSGIQQNKRSDGAEQSSKFSLFRRHCDQLRLEVARISDFMSDGIVTDEGLEVIVEIEVLLEQLYDCPWSEGENLRRVVVLLQSQLLNAKWTDRHVFFLRNAIQILRLSYVINDDLIDRIVQLVDEQGLDPFRGTVTETEVRKKYRIEEIS